jgi:nondiscriminating glutamyl-tRNA synthetase
MKVRTRFAPSPTGYVHIGSIYNVLFAKALADHYKGDFILRIEDTDQKRYVEGAVDEIYEMLENFGLEPDEGPKEGGPHTPYVQSERMKQGLYKDAAERLVEKGHAYYCFLTPEELKEIKGGLVGKNKKAFRSPHRDMPIEEAKAKIETGEDYVIRLKVPDNEEISVEDAILGKVTWNSNDVDDQVLLKSDSFPTYHLGVVVDDYLMKISHITRGYEWLPSTPKHILLYKYLGYEMPVFAHSPLILDPEGGKLSKRKGTVNARAFLEDGYMVDAILNFMMLLGWAPPIERKQGEKEREIFSYEEFVKLYELKDRNSSNPIFNRDKLIWFNQQYIQNKSPEELAKVFLDWKKRHAKDKALLEDYRADKNLADKLALVQERAKNLIEVDEMIRFFYKAPKKSEVDWEIKQTKRFRDKLENLRQAVYEFHAPLGDKASDWNQTQWVDGMKQIAAKFDVKGGDPFMIARIALVGGPFSPPLFEAMQILGKDEVLQRLEA